MAYEIMADPGGQGVNSPHQHTAIFVSEKYCQNYKIPDVMMQ